LTQADQILLVALLGAAGIGAWMFFRPRADGGTWITLPGMPAPYEPYVRVTTGPTTSVMPVTKTPSEWRAELMPLIRRQEHAFAMPAGLLEAVIENESSFRDDIITGRTEGSAGEQGIMQLKPEFHMDNAAERNNPYTAIPYGATYLAKNFMRFGDWAQAVIAYNCGPTDWENYGPAKCGPALAYLDKVEARTGSLV